MVNTKINAYGYADLQLPRLALDGSLFRSTITVNHTYTDTGSIKSVIYRQATAAQKFGQQFIFTAQCFGAHLKTCPPGYLHRDFHWHSGIGSHHC